MPEEDEVTKGFFFLTNFYYIFSNENGIEKPGFTD